LVRNQGHQLELEGILARIRPDRPEVVGLVADLDSAGSQSLQTFQGEELVLVER